MIEWVIPVASLLERLPFDRTTQIGRLVPARVLEAVSVSALPGACSANIKI